jgi:hypothetical protein
MTHSHTTEHQVQRAGELVQWTGHERLRFLWYRLRLTISEMNYATRRLVELQAPWISDERGTMTTVSGSEEPRCQAGDERPPRGPTTLDSTGNGPIDRNGGPHTQPRRVES